MTTTAPGERSSDRQFRPRESISTFLYAQIEPSFSLSLSLYSYLVYSRFAMRKIGLHTSGILRGPARRVRTRASATSTSFN